MPDWPEILSRHGPAAWQTAYRILGNRADADECFQESCLAALNVSRRQSVRQWTALLQRLAAARAIDRLRERTRRRAREQMVDANMLDSGEPLPTQRIEDDELVKQLRAALAQIPAKQSELFCLYLEQWSYQEIAEQLEISTSRVGVLLHRARKKLGRLLATTLDNQRATNDRPSAGPQIKQARKEPS